jgi:hypothetical protein
MEGQRWADSGTINLARAQWVALGMRGMTRRQKLALAEDMAAMDWSPTWAEPVTPPVPAPSTMQRKEKPVAL